MRVHVLPFSKENYNSHDTLVRSAGAVSFLALGDALVVTRGAEQIGQLIPVAVWVSRGFRLSW